jgi:glyoxylase-like metal-dependent hydrolase (beta-lactamase superfamily II)
LKLIDKFYKYLSINFLLKIITIVIKIQVFTFNAFQENTYVLHDDTKEAMIIDAGCFGTHEQKTLSNYISSQNLNVVKLVNTHCHIDHVLGNTYVKRQYKVPSLMHSLEADVLRSVKLYAPMYGFHGFEPAEADEFISEKDKLTFGNSSLDILFVPGHSIGHLAFYHREQGFCINGDVLFQGSIGRTDLPGGNFNVLINSIKTKLFTLPEETIVYCGHGEPTTIGEEKRFNPFCR